MRFATRILFGLAWSFATYLAAADEPPSNSSGPASAHSAAATEEQPSPVDPRQVDRLISRLDGREEDRARAREELLSLGLAILKHLPAYDSPGLNEEQRAELTALVRELRRRELEHEVDRPPIDWGTEPIPLDALLRRIEVESGNRVADMRERFRQDVHYPLIEIPPGPLHFWPLLDEICRQAELSPYPFSGDRTVGLVGGKSDPAPASDHGPFRLLLDRLTLQTSFTEGGKHTASARLEFLFEPRLKPLQIRIDPEEFTIEDDRGNTLEPIGEGSRAVIDPEKYRAALNFGFRPPRRDARRLARLGGRLRVLLPTRSETFEWDRWMQLPQPKTLQGFGVAATLHRAKDEDGIWSVPLRFSLAARSENVDSFLAHRLEAAIFLVDATGKTFGPNGGVAPFAAGNATFGQEYLFVDLPGEPTAYRLRVLLPTGAVEVAVPFEFVDIGLP